MEKVGMVREGWYWSRWEWGWSEKSGISQGGCGDGERRMELIMLKVEMAKEVWA